ncbi:hypothetical protein C9439_00145 [archaeon SCG-AAA382B04]|nr:hypothetical protein C9439_00145 [archaeon SCG-AAA382B04]
MNKKDSIIDLQKEVHKKLIKKLKELAKPHDLNHGELPLLMKLITEGDKITQKQLLKKLPVSKSTLSKKIDDLTKRGYLRKETDEQDKRLTLICLTDKSKEIEKNIKEIGQQIEKITLDGFSQKEQEELTNYLKRIIKNLENQK